MTFEERKAQVRSYLGKTVRIAVDRPVGYVHHKEKYDLVYPINYGCIPGVLGGDGEELDVYLLGVDEPCEEYTARVIGIIHRANDVEDKLVAAPEGMRFTRGEIAEAVNFQERYYISAVETEDGFGGEKVLFIDACARRDSRTRRLANALLDSLFRDAERVRLYDILPRCLDGETVEKRSALNEKGDRSDAMFGLAKQFADAEEIMIAAPYWDLSFPAVLKCYIENVCVNGMTFRYAENGVPQGLCRAKRAWYVATAGGYAGENLFGYGYIKTLFRDMFGIPETRLIIAEGLDIAGNDAEKILLEAIEKHTARG